MTAASKADYSKGMISSMKVIKCLAKMALIPVLVLSMLAGCSSSGGSNTSTSSNAVKGKVKIEFWYGLGSAAGQKMQSIIKSFNATHKNITVVGVAQPDYATTYQKLQAAIASNTAPGVALLSADYVHDLGKKKALAPLDPYIKNDKSMKVNDFLPVFMTRAKVGNVTYGLPAYGTTQVMYYRKDLFQKAGIDTTKAFSSWENLLAAAKTIQTKNLAAYGFEPMWGPDNLIDMALSNGGQVFSADGKKVTINTAAWINAWDMIRQSIFTDKTMMVNSGGQGWAYWYKTIDDVMKGRAGGYIGSSGDKGNLDFSKIDSAVQPGMNGHKAKPVVDALYMSVPSSISDNQKRAAYQFIAYFTSAKVNADWAKTIGYIPVCNAAMKDPAYAAFIKAHPYAAIPFKQAEQGIARYLDPTGGKITQALSEAADKVELQNVPAKQALDQAEQVAQQALDSTK